MKKYASFLEVRSIQGLQYQTAAYAGILAQFIWRAMGILLFSAFYCFESEAFPMDSSQLASCYWPQQAFLILFMTWFMEGEIFQAVSSGAVACEPCRLMNIYSMWFVKNLTNRAFKAVLRRIPILLTALLPPEPYGLVLPPDVKTTVLFPLSMILGFLAVVAFSILIYIATFFILSPLGIRVISLSLVELMSDGTIPLSFLPDRIRGIMELLPLASMQNAPYRIYSTNIAGAATVSTLSLQLSWVIALTVLGHYLMSPALKHVVIQGD